MPSQTPPATDVLLLVLAAWTTGTVVLGAATRLGGEVDPGHFKVIWLVSAALAALFGIWEPLGWALAAGCLAAFGAVYLKRDAIVGGLAGAGAVAVLLASGAPAVFGLAAALLLGAATNAMLLGHWHLNQPRLGTGPLRRLVWALWAGVGAFTAVSGVLVARALDERVDVAMLGGVTAIFFTLFTGILTAMVAHLVRRRSIQSATGILYLEILLVFVAVFTGALGALAPGLA